MQQSSWRS